MKSKKIMALLLIGVLATSTFMTGCGSTKNKESAKGIEESENFNLEGYPIVNETIKLKLVSPKASLAPNFGEMKIMQDLAKKCNIEIEWVNIPDSDYQTKKNLLIASNDLPDGFWNSGFSDYDLVNYGEDGTIIPIGEDLIEKYMPNLSAEMEKDPTIKSKLTAPDGNIYSLPGMEQMGLGKAPFFTSINTKWLENLGLSMPTTPEEFKEVLRAFKNQDANGNGNPNDEIPFSFMHMFWCADIGDLMAPFGMADNIQHRIVRDNKVIYTAVQDEYKAAIKYFHELYAEGLIDPESFTQDPAQYLAKGQSEEDKLGSFIWWETNEVVGANRSKDFALLEPFKNSQGQQVTGRGNGEDFSRAAFVITEANQHVAETLRFIDLMYAKDVSPQVNWGPIGDVFTETESGLLTWNEAPEGTTMGEYRQKVCPGGNSPVIITKDDFGTTVEMEPRALERLQTIESKFLPYMEKQSYPLVFFNKEELDTINTIETDITTYVNNKRATWILNGGIDSEWDKYKEELKKMGLDDLIKIYQDGLDRYNEAAKQ